MTVMTMITTMLKKMMTVTRAMAVMKIPDEEWLNPRSSTCEKALGEDSATSVACTHLIKIRSHFHDDYHDDYYVILFMMLGVTIVHKIVLLLLSCDSKRLLGQYEEWAE